MNTAIQAVVATVMAVLIARSAYAQADNPAQPQPDYNMACLERLEIPRYPPLATQARLEGTITASVLISPEGLAKQVDTQAESRLATAKSIFGSPVWKVISEATFRSECAGKTVVVVFHFNLAGVSQSNPKQTFSFGYPNVFWIVSETPHFQPQGTGKQ